MDSRQQDLVTLNINLNQEDLNESFLAMFGETVKIMLRRMFGSEGIFPRGTVKGTPSQISAFESALVANRNYINSYINNGLNNPATYRNRQVLRSAVSNFERQTNIKWPFK